MAKRFSGASRRSGRYARYNCEMRAHPANPISAVATARRAGATPRVITLLLSAMFSASVLASAPTATPPASQTAPEVSNPSASGDGAIPAVAAAPASDGAVVEETDLWQRVRRGFQMSDLNSPLVEQHELWYANRPDYMQRFVERGSRYLFHIVEEVEKRGMPTEIVLLPIIESAFNPQAYSRAHASGMWQFIPSTGKIFGLSQDWLTDNRRDVLLSTTAALDYLEKLHGMFGSWELAFAAYNCGEGCVGRAIAANQRRGLPTDFVNLRLPNETRAYVPKLLAVKNIVLSPASYGIYLPAVSNRPYFAKVPAPDKIDVALAARLAEMDKDAFEQLNPAFNKPVAASGTGHFLVPIENADVFRENLELYQSLNGPLVSWVAVTAKRGESVDAVARRHGMTASYLRATNGPFRERKGRFTQPVTFMAPNAKDAEAIRQAFDRKVALKRETLYGVVTDGDDGPLQTRRPQFKNASTASATLDRPLRVATVSSTASPPSVSVDETAAATASPSSSYVVERGDTLFSIAKRANIALVDLKSMNGLESNVVAAGRVLKLPEGTVMAPRSPRAALLATPSAIAPISTYVVRSGDTLFSIAKRFSTSVEALQRANRLTARATLRIGQRLVIQ